MNTGEAIRAARKAAGITQVRLAEKACCAVLERAEPEREDFVFRVKPRKRYIRGGEART